MSDLLSIGASGVRAYQTALSVTGENIANVGTPGYARRTVTLNEVSGGIGNVALASGNGVLARSVDRATDSYATAAVRSAGADLSRTQAGATWLDRIEKALTGNALTGRVTSFFNASTRLAAEPDSSALRSEMLGAAGSTAIAFTATGQAFDQIDRDMDATAVQATTQLNSLAQALVQVNDGLGRTPPGTSAAAQLTDQRDQILDQMSAFADIGVTTDALGRVAVKLGGPGGEPFVEQNVAATLSYSRNATGAVGLNVTRNGTVTPATVNGGALAGIVDGAQRVNAARTGINAVARDLVKKVNDNQIAGEDQTGAPGLALFKVGTRDTDISIDPLIDGGAKIAAAKVGGGKRDSSNLAALATLRADNGWEKSLTGLITDNATAYDQKNTIADAQSAIRDGAVNALTSVTGVNMDSEAIELMRFQQAYSASSRIIQVARDTFQSILEIR